MAPYDALYDRKCCILQCWTELGEKRIVGLNMVIETKEKVRLIQDQLKVASDRQKSYADIKRKDTEFDVGDQVVRKASPWKKILRFGYFETGGIGHLSVGIASGVRLLHDAFHVSMLRHYQSDPSNSVSIGEIEVRTDLTFEDELVRTLDFEVKVLRKKDIPLVKILWRNHGTEEATWELEDSIRQ
ncbi:uncharacterized protein [Gossypium hirsutum]|uniref:Uncharacterized protein n=1 Tax=Gossypium hirsutum TaxID=3635 RepID=A0A1U8PVP5_GOSHI|nr:uncharacterized protein LOC107963167 [Gossypium hirsutum]